MSINSDEFNSVSRRIIRDAARVASTAVQRATKAAVVKAKEGRFKDRTGNLRGNIFPTIEGWSGNWFWGLVTSPEKYSRYVEYPTAPHDIWPKAAHGFTGPLRSGQSRRASGPGPHEYIVGRGYALRWVDGSGEHFARMVHHPGTAGFKFMQAASFAAATTLRIAVREGFVGFATVH
jgi:hypothetical protein